MPDPIRVLVVGCGHMGTSHSRAYRDLDDFEIVGLVSRKPASREKLSAELSESGIEVPGFDDYYQALEDLKPDAVSINTFPETHADYCINAFAAGCHVFSEKPLGVTVEQAQSVVDAATASGKKLVVGYIIRVHPTWMKFVDIARGLGKPLVMRMNLNQQSSGANWETHKSLMHSMSPIVDCGVHYVDVMCLMTRAKPVRVSAIGARLSDEIAEDMYNYGMLQVSFDDGSVGWYEAGWGPMMSETAFFVKDVIGPKGCVSIKNPYSEDASGRSDDVDSHSKSEKLLLHHAETGADGKFSREDEWIDMTDEPDHDGLCLREQEVFLNAIRNDVDLTDHMNDAVNSLRIVIAADQSFKTGKTVDL